MMSLLFRVEKPLLLSFLVISVGANVVMAHAVRSGRLSRPAPVPFLTVGARAPQLTVETLDGATRSVNFTAAPSGTILYVLSPSCLWCERNSDNVAALASLTKGHYEFVAVTGARKGAAEYVVRKQLPFGLFVMPDAVRADYKLQGLPQTLVIDRDGVVMANWVGAYSAATQSEIEQHFGIRLPGLRN